MAALSNIWRIWQKLQLPKNDCEYILSCYILLYIVYRYFTYIYLLYIIQHFDYFLYTVF